MKIDKTTQITKIGEILYALDKSDLFSNFKLKGKSALFFLIKDLSNVPTYLELDLHTDEQLDVVNQIRSNVSNILPQVLLTKNFSLDVKKTKFTGFEDHYFIKDNSSKFEFELRLNYQYRKHILLPEYFARKDEVFKDLHLNCLSTLENYGIYLASLFADEVDFNILDEIVDQNKLLPQQLPFIRKIITFYIGLNQNEINIDRLKKMSNPKNLDFINIITNFSQQELNFLANLKNGLYMPEDLFGLTMSKNILNHPKALKIIKKGV